MRLYETENIDNASICTIAVNPKKYFKTLKNRSINKKTQRCKMGYSRNEFWKLRETDSERIEKKLVQKGCKLKTCR